jgi:hypothetical protein
MSISRRVQIVVTQSDLNTQWLNLSDRIVGSSFISLCFLLSTAAPTDDELDHIIRTVQENNITRLDFSSDELTRIEALCQLSNLTVLCLHGVRSFPLCTALFYCTTQCT